MAQYLNFQDMIDGGGAGASGPTFEGGPLSGLLNAIGVKPAGFRERMAGEQPSRQATYSGSMPPPVSRMPLSVGGLSGPAGMPVAPGLLALASPPMAGPVGMSMMPQKDYGGRGYVGMPMPDFADTPESVGVLDYLRSIGAVNY